MVRRLGLALIALLVLGIAVEAGVILGGNLERAALAARPTPTPRVVVRTVNATPTSAQLKAYMAAAAVANLFAWPTSTATPVPPPEKPIHGGRPVRFGDMTVTFLSANTALSVPNRFAGFTDGDTVKAKGMFVVVTYKVRNDGKTAARPDASVSSDLVLMDDRGRQWLPDASEDSLSNDFALDGNLSRADEALGAGFTVKSVVAFDVPADAKGLYILSIAEGYRLALNYLIPLPTPVSSQ